MKKNALNEGNAISFVNWDRDSIPSKSLLKYTFLFDKYSQANQPFFLLGKSSVGKNSIMLNFLSKLPQETYNAILLACTPQSTHQNVKVELKK